MLTRAIIYFNIKTRRLRRVLILHNLSVGGIAPLWLTGNFFVAYLRSLWYSYTE